MPRFTQLKVDGVRTRVNLSKVVYFTEVKDIGTELNFENGEQITVDESYQTVSNRANASSDAADE